MNKKYAFILVFSLNLSAKTANAATLGSVFSQRNETIFRQVFGWAALSMVVGFLVFGIFIFYWNLRDKAKKMANLLASAAQNNHIWGIEGLKSRIEEVFCRYQSDWSKKNLDSMKNYVTPSFLLKNSLLLDVLTKMGRRSELGSGKISKIAFEKIVMDKGKEEFVVRLNYDASSSLTKTSQDKLLSGGYPHNEFWCFKLVGNEWFLDGFWPAVEFFLQEISNRKIFDFATKQGFPYVPAASFLTLPQVGHIFGGQHPWAGRLTSSMLVYDYVIGQKDGKTFEFYRHYTKSGKSTITYTVGQMILPKEYKRIFVHPHDSLLKLPDLVRIETGSNEFDQRFDVWVNPDDQVHSLELLTPKLMAELCGQSLDVALEVIENYLFVYVCDNVYLGDKQLDMDGLLCILLDSYKEIKN
ncbi:DUF3137 domain-containing protein [Candidatus Falkowbacteria bacterium]|nr:DUF3137 domain-containing protein [Candidatus Falkowbacteria bacterium]